MTNPNELVSKYLKKINARKLPDGSPHPDDLTEAEFLATVEFLETGEIEPPEDCPPLSDPEAIKLWLETAKTFGTYESVLEFIAHAVKKHDRQVRNPPKSTKRLPDPDILKEELDVLLGSGLSRSSAIQGLADQYFVTPGAVRKCLLRGGHKAKK
jgi:hypothetical protein